MEPVNVIGWTVVGLIFLVCAFILGSIVGYWQREKDGGLDQTRLIEDVNHWRAMHSAVRLRLVYANCQLSNLARRIGAQRIVIGRLKAKLVPKEPTS